MFIVLGECRKNYRQATNTYAERYPNREKKLHMTFKRLLDLFYFAYGMATVKKKKEHEENSY